MIIKDVVNLAKYSELSGVAVKDNIDVITAFINLGMLELYKRFPIKVEEHIVSLVNGTSYYEMPDDFMYSLEAFAEADINAESQSVPIPINDADSPLSIFFIDWNTIQVPAAVTGSYISLVYVAKPASITAVQADDGTTVLDLPDTLIDALLSFIGYKAHMGVKSDAQSENNAHWVRFDRICKKARELGVAFPADSMSMSGRVSDRGFV